MSARQRYTRMRSVSTQSLFTHALAFFVGMYIYSCFTLNSKMNGVIVNEERDLYPLVSDSKTSLVNTAIEGERIEDNVVAGSTKGENEIPKVIHIVGRKWLTENDSWKKLNPEYNVEFYNDQRCLELVKEYYPHFEFVYSHLKSVRRYDFVRYLIVYHYGGIYADSDITCKEPINNWELRNETTFFTGMECIGCNYIGIQTIQWTFGATKGHPILDHVIKNVVSNSFKAPSFFERFGKLNKIIHMTGPAAFSDGITAYLIEKGTCEPKVGSFKNTKGFVTCSSIDPFGYTSGVQVFPWYRWGAAKNGDMPDRPPNIGPNDGKFIKHGYKGSWVNKG